MDRVGLERTTPAGLALLMALLGAMALGGWSLFSTGVPPLQVSGFMLWILTLAVCLVFRSGGVVEDAQERQERAAREQQAEWKREWDAWQARQQQGERKGGEGGGGAPAAA
jgi:hypothetical protein